MIDDLRAAALAAVIDWFYARRFDSPITPGTFEIAPGRDPWPGPRRVDETGVILGKMRICASHLGLFSGEIGSDEQQLTAFPQALSRLALISAAVNLDHQIAAQQGRYADRC